MLTVRELGGHCLCESPNSGRSWVISPHAFFSVFCRRKSTCELPLTALQASIFGRSQDAANECLSLRRKSTVPAPPLLSWIGGVDVVRFRPEAWIPASTYCLQFDMTCIVAHEYNVRSMWGFLTEHFVPVNSCSVKVHFVGCRATRKVMKRGSSVGAALLSDDFLR